MAELLIMNFDALLCQKKRRERERATQLSETPVSSFIYIIYYINSFLPFFGKKRPFVASKDYRGVEPPASSRQKKRRERERATQLAETPVSSFIYIYISFIILIPSFHFLGRKDHSLPQKMCKMRQCMGRELVCRDLWMDHVSACDLCTETLYMHNNLNMNSKVYYRGVEPPASSRQKKRRERERATQLAETPVSSFIYII